MRKCRSLIPSVVATPRYPPLPSISSTSLAVERFPSASGQRRFAYAMCMKHGSDNAAECHPYHPSTPSSSGLA